MRHGWNGSPAEGGKYTRNEGVKIRVGDNRLVCVREGRIRGSVGDEGLLDMSEEVGWRVLVSDRTWGDILFETDVVVTICLPRGGS